jgi:hypothetical protein
MSVGSVLKKVAGAGVGAGKAILGPSGIGAFTETAPQVAPAAGPPSAAVPPETPFALPDLDPADPDYEEKKAIHEAYTELSKRLAPDDGVNYQEKYAELAKHVASRPEPKHWSPFSSFAIAMGSPGAGASKVASDNARADEEHQSREDTILRLKEEALKGEIAQLAQKGNFKKMLTQTALLEELASTQKRIRDAREHKQKMEEIDKTNAGKATVAGIRASSARDVASTRASALADKYKLNYEARKAMLSLASHMIGGFQQQKDAAGEPIYSADDMNAMGRALVNYAEEHSPIFTDGGSTPPTAAPKGADKPAAPAGPKANDSVAAAFAARRAARAAAQK